MILDNFRQQHIKELEAEYDLLSDKIHHLRKARIIETDAADQFKLDQQIAQAEQELKAIEQRLNESDTQTDRTDVPEISQSTGVTSPGQTTGSVRIFLSYTRKDQPKVEWLYQQLHGAGFAPWIDTKDLLPGQRFEYEIKKVIRQSDFFLACLSPNSVDKRGFIQREIKEALDVLQEKLESDIYLIPVRLEECDVPESLREFHWANLYEADGLEKLVQAIRNGIENQRATIQHEDTWQIKSIAEKPEKREWTDPITGMEFVWIPAGQFIMGQMEAEKAYLIYEVGERHYQQNYTNELPRHAVSIDGLWMGKYPVTQEEWIVVMGKNPSYFNERRVGKEWPKHPLESISWDDVQEFLRKLNEKTGNDIFRLPSEAEWEYACRAGTETMFYFGDDVERLQEYVWYAENSSYRTHPVGQLKPNTCGLYDMLGSIWEWCQDIYSHDAYSKHQRYNPIYMSGGSRRVFRGGGWHDGQRDVRCASRNFHSPTDRHSDVGLRLVRTP
jgi:formylglycine-generating enzyme required for sulfatase activity